MVTSSIASDSSSCKNPETSSGASNGGRKYRSRKQRPCDFCRRRKSCCIINDKLPCLTCAKRGLECTFTEGPIKARNKGGFGRFRIQPVSNNVSTSAPENPGEGLPRADLPGDGDGNEDGGGDAPHKAAETESGETQTTETECIVDSGSSLEPAEESSSSARSSVQNAATPVPASMTPTPAPMEQTPAPMAQEPSMELGFKDSVPLSAGPSYEFDLPHTIDMWNLMFKDLGESLDPDLQKSPPKISTAVPTSRVPPDANAKDIRLLPSFHLQTQGINRFQVCSLEQIKRFIKGSVDADESIKVQYLEETSYMDPRLISAADDGTEPAETAEEVYTRPIGEATWPGGTPPVLLVRKDPGPSAQDVKAKERIRSLIGDFGPRLLLIYFRHINPFLPLFSRGLFYFGTNQNMLEFHNGLVATILALGLDWWNVDPVLQQYTKPSESALANVAKSSIMQELDLPNYSSLQACILLSQKRPEDPKKPDSPFTWALLGMASSLVEELGYNNECLEWENPTWEKQFRRRIWWTYVVQETWFAACYGHTFHISRKHWHVSKLTQSDFESFSMNEKDAENFNLSVFSFCFTTELTLLVSEICEDYLHSETIAMSADTLFQFGVGYLKKLNKIEHDCPRSLRISSQTKSQVAWANGSVQFAVQTAKILILRFMIHHLRKSIHYNKVIEWSIDCLQMCLALTQEIRIIHFQYFWYSWSRLNFAMISSFFLLIYSVSPDVKRSTVRDMLDNYRFWLRCNVSTFKDLALALDILDRQYKRGLSKLECKYQN